MQKNSCFFTIYDKFVKEKRLFPNIRRSISIERRMAVLLLAFMAMFVSVRGTWAQGAYDYTIPPDWEQVRITDIGVVVRDMEFYLREDLQTHNPTLTL
ncbi:MAG: hypothetical protein J6W75_07195 [Bacteroidaceae bacterium]|nr:hypothetical protein [Bacteroidaceae bacterium]